MASPPVLFRTASKIEAASYDGIPINITSTETSGGRKVAIKQIPNSDLQIVEDLGKKTRSFTLEGTVSARTNPLNIVIADYFSYRDALLASLEKGGGKDLVHPWFGNLSNVHCVEWTISESVNSIGDSSISLSMEVGSSDGLPLVSENDLSGSFAILSAVIEQGKLDVINNLILLGTGTHSAFLDTLSDIGSALSDASKLASPLLNKIDAYTKELQDFQGSLTDLAQAPGEMMDSINSLFSSVDGLYATFDATLKVYEDLFTFADGNPFIFPLTNALKNKKTNTDLMQATMQSQALSYGYTNASQIEFGSTEDIEAQSQVLEDQYQKMIADDFLGEEIRDLLTNLRETTQGFFDAQKLIARRVITVQTNPTTARVLAYKYYGSSELGLELMTLNNLPDPYLLEGDVRILTE